MTTFTLLCGMLIGSFVPVRRWGWTDRRFGGLPAAVVPTAEAARAARLCQLGEGGTYRFHNCGTILHVDYDRGELIVEREARHYR